MARRLSGGVFVESGEPHACHWFASLCCCTRPTACACWSPHRVESELACRCLLSSRVAGPISRSPWSQATISGFAVAYSSRCMRWYAVRWRTRSRKGARSRDPLASSSARGARGGRGMGVAPHRSGIESDNDLECFGYVLTLYFRVPVTKWCYIYVENHLSTI